MIISSEDFECYYPYLQQFTIRLQILYTGYLMLLLPFYVQATVSLPVPGELDLG